MGNLAGIKRYIPNSMKLSLRKLYSSMGDLVVNACRKIGIAVNAYRPDYHYCPQIYGKSHHKLVDLREINVFGELATKVLNHGRTCLYYDRLFFLYQAICSVRSISVEAPNMAEVGVYQGGGTYFMASVTDRLYSEKPEIHSFDTFEGHPEDISPDVDGPHCSGAFADTSLESVRDYLSGFDNVALYKGRFQDRCSEISGKSFSFVHIDTDIYSATRFCLDFFADLIARGGIVLVDDYGFTTCKGVMKAVDAFTSNNQDFMRFHLETGQCLLIRTRQ